jgi:hypothetical protein
MHKPTRCCTTVFNHPADANGPCLSTWGAAKQLTSEVTQPKRCPVGGCQGMVVGVKRYGRPANKALLDFIQKKHLEHGRGLCWTL